MTIQSFTGRIDTNNEFVTVESVATGFTFVEGNTYTMQVQNSCYLKVADAVFSVSNEKFNYTAGSEDMYIKTNYTSVVLTILENEGGSEPTPPVTTYTFTISPTPNDATVTLTATGATQDGNSITAADGTEISYSVAKEGYTTVSSTYTLDGADHTESVTLQAESISLSLNVGKLMDDRTLLSPHLAKSLSSLSVNESTTLTAEIFNASTGTSATVDWSDYITGLPTNTTQLTVTRTSDATYTDIDGWDTEYTTKVGAISYENNDITEFTNIPVSWTITPAKMIVVIDQELGSDRLVISDSTNHYKEVTLFR